MMSPYAALKHKCAELVTAHFVWKGRVSNPSVLFLFFFNFDDFASLVLPALGADGMGQAHLTAIGADSEIGGGHRIMGAAAVAASL
jgi:hypothetical protein